MKLSRRALLSIGAATLAFGMSAALNGAHAADAATPHVTLKTNMGNIVLELYPAKAPLSVANFLEYVKSGQYDGTIFHRVIPGFMIQGGGFDQNMHEKPTRPPIKNEAKNGLNNTVYTIAMARTQAPHSATAQFFINTANNGPLDYPSRDGWGYAVFGKVIDGAAVVDKIKMVKTTSKGMYQDVPETPVVIESASITD
ncbi:peptidyl-prolyl cis-trans isomerase [Oxalobacteraceae bacterium CAVE-383]|nr:peptidyl-prolyl cis-trans isomerase [Oxalobacteraceae bacterium CAVE-383]